MSVEGLQRVRSAAAATAAAGTCWFTARLRTEPTGIEMTGQGVRDFAADRTATRLVFAPFPGEDPGSPLETVQLTDAAVVYTEMPGEDSPQWLATDAEQAGADLVAGHLRWLPGVVEAEPVDDAGTEFAVRLSARVAVQRCDDTGREALRAAFTAFGHLDSEAHGRVTLDDRGRVGRLILHVPSGTAAPDGTVHDAADVDLRLEDFGLPAAIGVPDTLPPESLRLLLDRLLPRH